MEIVEPLGTSAWRACSGLHGERLGRVLGWARDHARFLRAGVLGALGVYLVAMPFAGTGRLGPVSGADVVAFFKLGVGATVLPLGWLATRLGRPAADGAAVPFPVHIQALIGTWAVLWLFEAVAHFAARGAR